MLALAACTAPVGGDDAASPETSTEQTTSSASPAPEISSEVLQQIAAAFNDSGVVDTLPLPEHLAGGELSFPLNAVQLPGDGSGGWRFPCQFRPPSGIMAENCEARIFSEASPPVWKLTELTLEEEIYLLA